MTFPFKKTYPGVLILLFFLNILTWLIIYQLNQIQFLEVNFFAIGQGDAIFIQDFKGHQILIDGGPNSLILEKLGGEMPFWDRTIDLVILTHPENDHLFGLIEVLKNYRVKNILWTGVVRSTPEFQEWLKVIQKEKAKIKIGKAGTKIIIPLGKKEKSLSAIIKIFYPFENLEGKYFKNTTNNTSLVSQLKFQNISFLFSGDIYKLTEKKIINFYHSKKLKSQVLKIAHHGSKTSSSEEFLLAVLPQIAIIQLGKENPYHHPHFEVLEILKKYDIKTLRTDLLGDIKIISNGREIKLKFKSKL
jgi:competence protein ComEC